KSGNVRVADGCAQTAETRFPTAAAMHALCASRWTARICFRAGPIKLVKVEAPFPHVSGHVLDSERTGAERKCAYRRTFRVIGVGDEITRDVITSERDLAGRMLVRPSIHRLSPHRKLCRRNKNHRFAERVGKVSVARTLDIRLKLDFRRGRLFFNAPGPGCGL